MRLEAITKEAYIELKFVEVVSDSAKASISVTNNGFSGHSDHVWLEINDIKEFVCSLKELDKTLKGTACLKSIEIGEFILNIENIDRLGHFLLTYELSKKNYIRGISQTHLISGGFEVEAALIKKGERMFSEQLNSYGY